MTRKTFTWRAEADLLDAVALLSKSQGRTANAFVTAAVEARIADTAPKEAQQLESLARKLRSLPDRKKAFDQAKAAFVEAEMSGNDPAEGTTPETELDAVLDKALRA
ncbi:MAG: hypothetical protein WBF53_16860 [Litorimonas sp.]